MNFVKIYNKISDKILLYLPFLIIIAGIYIRFGLYSEAYPLWHDEIVLAENVIFKTFAELFMPLVNLQVAPPLYLFIQKVILQILNYNILSFRLISILSGCIALPLFYVLLNKTFKSRLAVNTALFLFAFNPQLIYYSNEFKPYETDVLICILLFLLYFKFNLTNIKSFMVYSLILFEVPFFSFPSIIVISAMIILKCLSEPLKEKLKYACLFLPVSAACGTLWVIEQTHYEEMTKYFLWENAFFNFSVEHNYQLLHDFLEFIKFNPENFLLIISFSIISIFITKNRIMYLSIWCLIFCGLASFCRMFPFAQRAILFLIPVLILLISNLFEIIDNSFEKKSLFRKILLIIMLILMFCNLQYSYKDILINKKFPMIESKDLRYRREKAITNFLDNYKSQEEIITTLNPAIYMNVYNTIKN